MYRIREVDGSDEDIADIIRAFNEQTADFPALTDEELDNGYWVASLQEPNAGSLRWHGPVKAMA